MSAPTPLTDAGPDFSPWPDEVAARYRAAGYWAGVTLGQVLADSARRHGDRPAVVDAVRTWTYRQLDHDASRLATGFARLGIGRGDRVLVQMPNVGEFVVICFALFRIGAVPVLTQPAHRTYELVRLCEQSGAVAHVVADRHAEFDYRALSAQVAESCPSLRSTIVHGDPGGHVALADLYADPYRGPGPEAGDVALLQLSGGSSAVPKLIPRTHDDYAYNARASLDACPLGPGDVYLAALPVAHNFTLCAPGILGALTVGATVVVSPSPSVEKVFPLIERHRVTVAAAVPAVALRWLDAADSTTCDLSSLRVMQVGGARLKPSAARRVRPTLGCTLQQVFGMAEGLICYTRPDDPDEIVVETQGVPMSPADEIRVVDDDDRPVPDGTPGHLLTRGPYTIRGYYRAAEYNRKAFTADGFYRTGDVVRRLPSGHLVVVDRAKDIVNRGGTKVACEEIEEILMNHPGVHNAAVVGKPDDVLGERVWAFVIPQAPLERGDLADYLHERGVAAYKVPDRFELVQEFPFTAVGKVDKLALRQRAAQEEER
ncbi:(2,3-dihydroxybenzoyl)adenylate synthase [Micromonospora andamanensis]|uniref:2,3-dihydroxybenzoate-AMP ligase n=1 Tax=Micromonospora andamanensis TaxID=1287068 RepID=A0ABQ4HZK2_9ACTN|nr:AMP-binding protein [Micromonospora andamanensis]GIJ11088.1 2,3-dihydroxybenzoate-AMP ligase [Micromonospora andamanensis]